jgi:hypothetical protein
MPEFDPPIEGKDEARKDEARYEGFEELSPSGHQRRRRRRHGGPYNAPIPEAADINALRHDWRGEALRSQQAARSLQQSVSPSQIAQNPPVAGSPPSENGSLDHDQMEALVRRLTEELQNERAGSAGGARPMRQGEHPADQIPPPLPSSIAVLNRPGMFDRNTGKRRRKREHDSEGGRRECPFCHKRRALHIRPTNPISRLVSLIGVRAYSCRNCHNQHMAFSFMEGPYLTWRQIGVFGLIALLLVFGYFFASPLINRLPD